MLALLLAGQIFAQVATPPRDVTARLEALRPRLVELMRAGIETPEPNAGWFRRLDGESLFDGSYDWHSCVIAHLALSVETRRRPDAELEAWLAARLTPEALAAEDALLARRDRSKAVTYPYDEAWYLVLLAELDRPGADPGLRAMRLAVEERLLDWLEERPFPEGVPGTEYCGFYRSWLFAFLLVQLSDPVGEDSGARLARLHADRVLPRRRAVAALAASHDWDFLWLPAVLALVERTGPGPALEGYDPGAPAPLPDEVTIATVHPLGVALSRLWPAAWDARRGDEAAARALEEHLAPFLAREDLWAGDFASSSHWLPQYLWLVLWFGAESG